jgi:hypothetical protein
LKRLGWIGGIEVTRQMVFIVLLVIVYIVFMAAMWINIYRYWKAYKELCSALDEWKRALAEQNDALEKAGEELDRIIEKLEAY